MNQVAHHDDVKAAFLECFAIECKEAQLAYLQKLRDRSPETAYAVCELLNLAGTSVGSVALKANKSTAASQLPTKGITPSSGGETETLGKYLGRYKLLEQIGEGGMGSVFMAEQTEPIRRRVAVKVIKPGMDSQQVIARFEAERQALALMDHPNIAKVFDAGTTETGRPYFVLELAKGMPLTQYCQTERLEIPERLRLFIELCRGIQHAHQRGIIHRDIKPSNVLVTLHDGKPVIKIIDFGIAKAINQSLTDKTLFTSFAQIMGTPLYMSPEQADMSGLEVDTRSDVYSLGAVLYELLTDLTSITADSLRSIGPEELRKLLRETDPVKPSQRLASLGADPTTFGKAGPRSDEIASIHLRGELDWIVMKAIEKERDRRYQSASDFADDVQRYLDDEPVAACPPSIRYRWSKSIRRNRIAFLASAAVFASLILGLCATSWQAFRATDAERLAERRLELEIAAREQANEQRIRADQEAELAKAIASFLQNDLLAFADIEDQLDAGIEPDPDVRVRTLLSRASRMIEVRFKDNPRTRSSLYRTVGNAYETIGLPNSAIPPLEKAVAIDRETLDDDDQEIARSLRFLSIAYLEAGDLDKADELLREALPLSLKTLGADSENHQHLLMAKVKLDYERGLYEDAANQLLEMIAGYEQTLGPENRRTLQTKLELASQFVMLQELDQAMEINREVLQAQQRKFGSDHPDTVATKEGMGAILNRSGDYIQADRFLREAWEGFQKLYGPDDARTLKCAANLGRNLITLGRIREAEDLLEDTQRIAVDTLGNRHPATELAQQFLASVYVKQRKLEKALPLRKSILESRREQLGDSHNDVISGQYLLAELEFKIDPTAKAEKNFRTAIESAETHLGADSAPTLTMKGNFAVALSTAGRFPESMELQKEILATERRLHGTDSIEAISTRFSIAVLLARTGETDEAVASMTELAATLQEPAFRDRILNEKVNMELGHLLSKRSKSVDRYARAEEAYRRAHEYRVRSTGPFHRSTTIALEYLVAMMLLQKKDESAIDTLRNEIEKAEHRHGEADAITINMYDVAAKPLYGMKRYEKALPFVENVFRLRRDQQRADDVEVHKALTRYVACLRLTSRLAKAEKVLTEHLALIGALPEPRKEALSEVKAMLSEVKALAEAPPDESSEKAK